MTTKSTWQEVHDQLIEDDRRKLGEPPTAEEVEAYLDGTLSEEEEARVRALLVAYPELARTLTHPFPSEEDGDVFSDDELTRRLGQLQPLGAAARTNVVPFRALSAALAVAATLALVFGALLWEARRELGRPHLAAAGEEILPDGRRGGGDRAIPVGLAGEPLVLMVSIADQPEFPKYRLEIVDAGGKRIWQSEPAERPEDEAFNIVVPRGVLREGRYQIVVIGVDGVEQQLSKHSFRVQPRG